MLKLSRIKVFPNTLRHLKIQTYRLINFTVIGHQICKKWAIFGVETKSKIYNV